MKRKRNAYVPWFLRPDDVSMLRSMELRELARWLAVPGHLEQFRRVRALWLSLALVLPGAARPTNAEIQADAYDGAIPLSQWLAKA
jgi:hypothetical protein